MIETTKNTSKASAVIKYPTIKAKASSPALRAVAAVGTSYLFGNAV
ncbi:hypothetical protein [Pontibacter saemangeumensis]